jgi:hypothetical protein
MAADIIMDIDANPLDPQALPRSLTKAPQAGDTTTYGNGIIFPNETYTWRMLGFSNVDWGNIHDIEDDIHRSLGIWTIPANLENPQSFAGKHHALAFFLVYVESPDARKTKLCVRSDDSVRVWLNGEEIEALRYAGERDAGDRPGEHPEETCAEISLR